MSKQNPYLNARQGAISPKALVNKDSISTAMSFIPSSVQTAAPWICGQLASELPTSSTEPITTFYFSGQIPHETTKDPSPPGRFAGLAWFEE